MRTRREPAGFTLIELLIAVVIVGILAAVALPNFLGQSNRSRLTEATGVLSAIAKGQEEYRFKHPGQYFQIGTDAPAFPAAGATSFQATVPTKPGDPTTKNTAAQKTNFLQVLGVDIDSGGVAERWYFSTTPRSQTGTLATGAADGTGVAAADVIVSAYGIDPKTLKLGVLTVGSRSQTVTDTDANN